MLSLVRQASLRAARPVDDAVWLVAIREFKRGKPPPPPPPPERQIFQPVRLMPGAFRDEAGVPTIKLAAEPKDEKGWKTARELRRTNRIPVLIQGCAATPPAMMSTPNAEPIPVTLHEVQRHYLNDLPMAAFFLRWDSPKQLEKKKHWRRGRLRQADPFGEDEA
eukprot:tig00001030_g6457.t1